MGPKLYSGWGVRTMAEGEGGYNPIGYHLGTVWPHDNAFVAMGLRRYGYREEAARVAMGMLEAATYFKGRLPEAFAGYPRQLTEFPVEYPTACSPQAWSRLATTFSLIQPSPRCLANSNCSTSQVVGAASTPSVVGELPLPQARLFEGRDEFQHMREALPGILLYRLQDDTFHGGWH